MGKKIIVKLIMYIFIVSLSFELNSVLMDFFNEMECTFLCDYFKLLFLFFAFYFKKDKSYYRPNSCFNTIFMTATYSENVKAVKMKSITCLK